MMFAKPFAKPLLGIAALVTILALPGLTAAQTCVSDSDCAQGLTCQANAVAPTPACPPEADCFPTDVPTSPSMSCQPAPCQADTTCGQGMVCHSQTSSVCSGGTTVAVKCDPNTVCDPATPTVPPVCTDTTTSQCVYKWSLPCNADADCGDGFVCQPSTMGMCSGSGSGAVSGGSASSSSGTGGETGSGELPSPPPTPAADGGTTTVCTTVTSYPGSCWSKVTTCNADSDCPSTWKCVTTVPTMIPNTATSAPMPVDGGVVSAQTPTITAIATATETSTATSVSTCQSPTSYPPRTAGVTEGGTGTSQTTDTAPSTPDAGATTKGATMPPTTATPGGGTTSTDTKATAAATGGGGGCSLGAGNPSRGSAVMLGLFGALLALRARRGRKS